MTLFDLLKAIDLERDKDKVFILRDNEGWTNVTFEIKENEITIKPDYKMPFDN